MTQTIKCPECGEVQEAKVGDTIPWPTYIHNCQKCDHTIMESEWEEVKPLTEPTK